MRLASKTMGLSLALCALGAAKTLLAMPAPASTAVSANTPVMEWHVSLRSGFDLTCARIETVGAKARLYLHEDKADFVDVNATDIVASEQVEAAPPPVDPVAGFAAVPVAGRLDLVKLSSFAATRVNLDADLIASIIHAESAGNPHAVSRTGARGLMQLMPGTAGQLGVRDPFNPSQNVNGGTTYFNQLLVLYHDNLALALAAYNAGPAAVAKYHGIPPYRETRAYVARVIREFNRRKLLARTALPSAAPIQLARNGAAGKDAQ